MLDLSRNIKLPDISRDKIIETREYSSPDGAFYIQYVTYSNGILFGNLRGLSQVADVLNYFKIRDEMVSKAGYKEYVEIRDNSENVNTTREGRAEIVRYYGRLDASCRALIFANASTVVNLQVKIGKMIIRNKNLFTTTTSTVSEAIGLAYEILTDNNHESTSVISKDKWHIQTTSGEIRFNLIVPDIIYTESSGKILPEDQQNIANLHDFFIEDNSLGSKKIFYIYDFKNVKQHNAGLINNIIRNYLGKVDKSNMILTCLITKNFWRRNFLRSLSLLKKLPDNFIFAKSLKDAIREINKFKNNQKKTDKQNILQINEDDFNNIFSLIQQINFNFDEEIQVPATNDIRVNEIFESLLLLRNDINVYMLKLNEKITELQAETDRRMVAENDLSDKNEKLHEANSYIASVFNTIADPITVIDFDGNLIDCNEAYIAMSGYGTLDIKNINIFNYYDTDDQIKFRQMIANHSNNKREIFEAVKYRTDGSKIYVLISSSMMPRSNGKPYVVSIIKDIGEIKRYQKQLQEQNSLLHDALSNLQQSQEVIIKQEKLASLGTMVAGIAHEINNPTQAIKFSIESLGLNIRDIHEFLDEIKQLLVQPDEIKNEKLDKIRTLVTYFDMDSVLAELDTFVDTNLKSVSRVEHIVNSSKRMAYAESIFTLCSINQIIEDAIILVDNQTKYSMNIITLLGTDLPRINGLAQELGQVFINLLINSRDAIIERGLSKDEGQVVITTSYQPGHDNITIRVSDNGKGIDPENILKIFDPFFTTKAVGKGTGLGLNLVHRIIDTHHGQISAESNSVGGADFIIHLPCVLKRESTIF